MDGNRKQEVRKGHKRSEEGPKMEFKDRSVNGEPEFLLKGIDKPWWIR